MNRLDLAHRLQNQLFHHHLIILLQHLRFHKKVPFHRNNLLRYPRNILHLNHRHSPMGNYKMIQLHRLLPKDYIRCMPLNHHLLLPQSLYSLMQYLQFEHQFRRRRRQHLYLHYLHH